MKEMKAEVDVKENGEHGAVLDCVRGIPHRSDLDARVLTYYCYVPLLMYISTSLSFQ